MRPCPAAVCGVGAPSRRRFEARIGVRVGVRDESETAHSGAVAWEWSAVLSAKSSAGSPSAVHASCRAASDPAAPRLCCNDPEAEPLWLCSLCALWLRLGGNCMVSCLWPPSAAWELMKSTLHSSPWDLLLRASTFDTRERRSRFSCCSIALSTVRIDVAALSSSKAFSIVLMGSAVSIFAVLPVLAMMRKKGRGAPPPTKHALPDQWATFRGSKT
jgi:hypothetical protein